MFRELKIKRTYRTKFNNIDKDFIIPVLRESIKYDRASGYFSIAALIELTEGLIPFIKKKGNMRLVTSVNLSPEDREIIYKGLNLGRSNILATLEKEVEQAVDEPLDKLKLDIIMNLIALGRIEIRIAYMPENGIYHEKIGLMYDREGEVIFFNGSSNETVNAYRKNYESIVVLSSWLDNKEDIEEQIEYYNILWNNEVPDLEVFTFPEALEERLFQRFKKSDNLYDAISIYEDFIEYGSEKIENKKSLYKYQEKAIDEFINNGGSHLYAMATGTGKTFTAIKTIEKVCTMNDKVFVIILVPQVDLQIQWYEALKDEGIKSYLFGGIAPTNWEITSDESIIDFISNDNSVVCVSTYDTYFSKLIAKFNKLKRKMLLVDEAHNLSVNQMNKLPNNFEFRLGLSATPERHKKSETERIISYFTKDTIEPYEYTIEEAIENNFLSRYNYYPLFITLEADEFEKYQNYTKKIMYILNAEVIDEEALSQARTERSLIVKKASNKILKLKEMVESGEYNFHNSVVYCGQGKDTEVEERIIDRVTTVLGKNGGYNVSQFTSKTTDRKLVLKEFEREYYDTLIAIKCFDEGVDVPKLDKIYIMASDSLARQTIQRRGRVLRKCKETGKNLAYIYDMVVLPPDGIIEGIGAKSLVVNEFRRVKEYMRLSENKNIEELKVIETESRYGISEEDYCGEE